MPIVKTADLHSDLILGVDVLCDGQMLLKKGLKLTAGHIKILEHREVESVYVLGPGETSASLNDPNKEPLFIKKARAQLDRHFRHNAAVSHPAMKRIKECAFRMIVDGMIKRGEV